MNWVKIGDAPTQGNYITKTAEKIRPEGLSKTREVHPGDLILSNSMSFGKPYIMGIDGCIHDGWLLIRNTYGVFDLTFLCHLLGTPQMLSQYRSLAAGSTVNNLNKELVGNTVVTIPSITEQRVLGDYLEQLDNLITLHQRKYEKLVNIKKSMLDKMFPQNGASVPEIRFKGFTDPWEQRKFVDFVEASGIRNKDNLQLESYSVSNDRGFVPQDEQFENGGTMRDADKTAYWIVEPGSFAYNPARINVGSIGYQSTRKNVIVSSLYEVFKTDRSCDDRFLWHWFKSSLFTKQIEMLQEGGVRLYFFFDKLQKSEIWMPNVDEQRIIGQQFDQLDSLITLHQRKYDKLVIFKKSMLEKMFPKDGESVPEIRFAGFTDPWEQRKLGEIVSIGAGAPPSAFSAGNFLYVKVDDLNESSHFQFDSAQRVDANTAVKPIRKGSIIFAKRGAAILGNKVRVLGKTAYIDTNMMALEPRGVDADFLWLFINQTGLYRIADTSTIPQINNKHIEPYPVDIPNMAEQQAIGTFFSRLDDLITLHQRKLELLQNIKKSLLDKMFV